MTKTLHYLKMKKEFYESLDTDTSIIKRLLEKIDKKIKKVEEKNAKYNKE